MKARLFFNSQNQFESLYLELKRRNFSPKTIKAYLHYNRDFLRIARKDPRSAEIRPQKTRNHADLR